MNTIINVELAHYLIKNLGAIRGKEKLEQLIQSNIIIIDVNISDMLVAVNKLAEYTHIGVGGRDSTILATMDDQKIRDLITHDNSFS